MKVYHVVIRWKSCRGRDVFQACSYIASSVESLARTFEGFMVISEQAIDLPSTHRGLRFLEPVPLLARREIDSNSHMEAVAEAERKSKQQGRRLEF